MSFKATINTDLVEKKWKGKNLLKIMEDDCEVMMDEDWDHHKEEIEKSHVKTSKEKMLESSSESESDDSSDSSSQSSSSSSSSSSEESISSGSDEEKSFTYKTKSKSQSNSKNVYSSEDESFSSIQDESDLDESSVKSYGSLYQLIEKEKDFICLNVMIQMEHCNGDTLRELLDTQDNAVNRKVNFHYFK